MRDLSKIGRIFYGIAITAIGIQSIYNRDLPYIVSLPDHFPLPAHITIACIFGIIFTMAGLCILFEKNARPVSLWFGGLLLFLFFFYCVPYEILTSPNYIHLGDWENAEKELAFAGGALAIAGCFSAKNEARLTGFLAKLIPCGPIIYAVTIVTFGILHFMEAKDAATYIPDWIPWHMFWIYFCGACLIGSGIAIIFKIRVSLFAGLLGLMIFIWVVSLHIPKVINAASPDERTGEITSAFLALAYCGIALVVAGNAKEKYFYPAA